MAQTLDIVEHVSNLLDSGKYKEALSVPNDEKFADTIKDSCWDLISLVVGKINDDTMTIKPSLHNACEELLLLIIKKATPEEALLEFIEQVEVAKNDAQFSIVLIPLQQLLKKLSVKRGRSLEWCLNSISTYIESIPIMDPQLEGQERLLLDCDNNVRRVTRVYTLLPPFYNPFIKELNTSDAKNRTKQIITTFLISLFGKPLIFIDLDPEANATSEIRQSCDTIIQDICTIEKDVCKFLVYLEICSKELKKSKSKSTEQDDGEEKSPYEHREKINMTTLSGLFYAVFSGHFDIPDLAMPQVYCTEYIIHTVMLAVVHLLSFTDYGPLVKAKFLCKALLDKLPDNVSFKLLQSHVHYDLCKGLMNIAIYSQFETLRKDAVNILGKHVSKFDYKGRCMLIRYILEKSNHSGMIGYAITLLKNAIDSAFKEPELPECFTGQQLNQMVKRVCHLPHGAESDLMELADQIISALNFLRYLALKDCDNKSGIRECFAMIETCYLDQLRTALNMSKAHYEVKLKDIIEGKDKSDETTSVSITVGGNSLDQIPTDKKREIIQSALNAFHLMEGLVARLSECININKGTVKLE